MSKYANVSLLPLWYLLQINAERSKMTISKKRI